MKKIKCIIVDDEPLALELMERYVHQTPFLELTGQFANAIEALDFINIHHPDLIFLDIQMPDLSGIELSRIIKNGPKVIFTTAFTQYAIEGFKVDALDYLLKPINYEEFLKAASKAREWFELKSSAVTANSKQSVIDYIFVKSEYKLVRIRLADVLYIEGLKDYVKIYMQGENHPVLSLMSLKSLEEQLPSSFMRIHRSFIIHLDKVEAMERGKILINKVYVPLADQYKAKFMSFLASKAIG